MVKQKPSPALKWYRRKAFQNTANGLTTKGTVRRRRPNARNRQQKLAMRRERVFWNWQVRATRLRQLNLTTRGTERIYAVRRGDAILLRMHLENLAKSLHRIFENLDNEGKAEILEIEKHLAAITKQTK